MKLVNGGIYKARANHQLYLVTLPEDYNKRLVSAHNYFIRPDSEELKCGAIFGVEELSKYAEEEDWELVAKLNDIFRAIQEGD